MAQDVPKQSHSTAMNMCVAHSYKPRYPDREHRCAQQDREACAAQKLRCVSPYWTEPEAELQQLWSGVWGGTGWGGDTRPLEEEKGRSDLGWRWEAVPAQGQFCSPHSHMTQA